jgi:hypothetical protein
LPAGNKNQGISRLEKKEGRLTARETHFFGVFFVITAYTINAVNGKLLRFSNHWDTDYGRGRKKVLHMRN